MKRKLFFSILVFLSVFFTSCFNNNKNQIEYPDDPSFISLQFKSNKNTPNVEKARFVLKYDDVLKDSIIVNLDSLPYKTRIDSVIPVFSFKSSSKIRLFLDDVATELSQNSKDTVATAFDFNKSVKVENVAYNGKAKRTYQIKVNVHQINLDLYEWNKLEDEIIANIGSDQKAILFKGQYFFFFSDATQMHLLSSIDAKSWTKETFVMPSFTSNLLLSSIVEHDGKLYSVTENNEVYCSEDAKTWNKVNNSVTDYKIKNILYSFNGKIWALAEADGKYYFVASSDGSDWDWNDRESLLADFPILESASLVFKTTIGNQKILVVGGVNASGTFVKGSWSSSDSKKWVFFPDKQGVFKQNQKLSLVQYNKKLLLFGANKVSDSEGKAEKGIFESNDEGFTWTLSNEKYLTLPDALKKRDGFSAFVAENEKRFFLVGGTEGSKSFSDFWNVELKRLIFNKD